MRRITELSSSLRGMALGGHDWGRNIHDGTIGGGAGRTVPIALAVLAAAESRFMFFLVKLSGCRDNVQGGSHEPVAEAHPDVVGAGTQEQ